MGICRGLARKRILEKGVSWLGLVGLIRVLGFYFWEIMVFLGLELDLDLEKIRVRDIGKLEVGIGILWIWGFGRIGWLIGFGLYKG